MNLFYLSNDPQECAEMHCDAHSSKMCVEYAQMMSTAHRVLDGYLTEEMRRSPDGTKARMLRTFKFGDNRDDMFYKSCHVNHPSNLWLRESAQNYTYTYNLWVSLCNEYTHRYGRVHESYAKLKDVLASLPINIDRERPFSQPTPAMKKYPECIVKGNSLQSYRNFYWADKRQFAKWTKRDKPTWWLEYEQRFQKETPESLAAAV